MSSKDVVQQRSVWPPESDESQGKARRGYQLKPLLRPQGTVDAADLRQVGKWPRPGEDFGQGFGSGPGPGYLGPTTSTNPSALGTKFWTKPTNPTNPVHCSRHCVKLYREQTFGQNQLTPTNPVHCSREQTFRQDQLTQLTQVHWEQILDKNQLTN